MVNGAEVIHYKILEGEHTWPRAPFTIGVTNRDFNASKVIWEFFSRYEKSTLVSVNEINNEDNWLALMSENPTTGLVSFSTQETGTHTISVFDMKGKQVYSSSSNLSTIQLDLSNQTSGIYFLTVQSNGRSGSFKLVKQ